MVQNKNVIYGLHAVQTMLDGSPQRIQQLYLLKGRNDKRLQSIRSIAEKNNITLFIVSREKLDQMVAGKHQGAIAVTRKAVEVYDEVYLKSVLKKLQHNSIMPFLLVLDSVTDPHNLGACLRSAEAAGIQCVVIPKNNSASLTPVAIKVACGAAEVLPLIRVTNLSRTLEWLQAQGVWLVGAAGEAEQAYYDMDLRGPLAIVMGAEGKGLRRLTRERCDSLIHIPMLGTVSSLNVSVATGVCLFEALRQRRIEC
ncbi:23S rRNA (guanosine(2251)-2'-O)-methyltransferase RlmB [Candidatus Endobugula sertula]|uniref:23S rRNA (guanosine-2'-O-)-methyltransferase RlmB n=1 Tax=Candidatus Endobugula sertula TaxID=62101 RepID=A0A1D2QMM1_9GAMM|nr:23S rRNA (guanosine(2251)-2'-O)-methyltransferase RlmB [Candidatus Endobugula sertula]